jgi:hypothetical protein
MPPFLASVRSKQEEFIKAINNIIITRLREDEKWLAEDITFVVDAPEVMGEMYYINVITNLKTAGILNQQQSIDWMKKLGIIREDILEVPNIDEKIVDPFKVMDKDALGFKPTDTDAKKDMLGIINAIKQREEEQKFKVDQPGETSGVVNDYMSGNRKNLEQDIKDERKKIEQGKK